MKRIVTLCLALAVLGGCSGPATSRVALDNEEVISADLKAVDIRTSIDKMARSLAALPVLNQKGEKPVISFVAMEDRTDENIDGYNLLSNIRKRLMAESSLTVKFVDRTDGALAAIEDEKVMKEEGRVTGMPGGANTGADFFLTGYLYRMQRSGSKGVEQYYRLSFRLTDAKNSEVVWEDDYEVKRAAAF